VEYEVRSRSKLEILKANDVIVVPLAGKNKLEYYMSILKQFDV
jgi:hypothetical protein